MKNLLTIAFLLVTGSLVAQSTKTVTVGWTDPNNPTGTTYNVYRASSACAGTPTFIKLNVAPIAAFSYDDKLVPPGTYCYFATANGTSGVESGQSPSAGATIPFPPQATTVVVK